MKRVLQHARRAASVDTTVLIAGEPGTGKSLLAKEIHRNSHRRYAPLINYYPAQLKSGDALFGSTDATDDRTSGSNGAVHRANKGTLLIHEIAALDLTDQARLLNMIESNTATAGNTSQGHLLDVRFIATTSRDLNSEVKAGRFRNDLLYRVSVFPIRLPPLRSRREDIPALVRHFLDQHPGENTPELESRLIEVFADLEWPGNIRQLKHAVDSMVRSPLQSSVSIGSAAKGGGGVQLTDVEKETILAVLHEHDGNRTRAAKSLGISVRTLQRRLRQWHLDE